MGLHGVMGFMNPERVINDTERRGMLRADIDTQTYETTAQTVDYRHCQLRDLSSQSTPLDLHTMGFDTLDLSGNPRLMSTLQHIKQRRMLDQSSEKQLRRALSGAAFRLSNGKRLRLLHVASEGLILRQSGPDGLTINPDDSTPKNSRQSAAQMVHGDQDVYGYPIKSILKGAAPYLFRHQSPDGKNQRSPLNLVNLWIPLQQITMPLCLMDRRTLNSKKHQVRMAISVKDVLDRQGANNRNDIWTFLYDDQQQWYCHSHMPLGRAYVFDTLGVGHGAARLQGEDQAAHYYQILLDCLEAIKQRDISHLQTAASAADKQLSSPASPQLAHALHTMALLVRQAAQQPEEILNHPVEWRAKAMTLLDSVVRRSIELRALALVY